MEVNKVINLDCVKGIEEMYESGIKVDGVITSPPYNTMRNMKDEGGISVGYDSYEDSKTNEEYSEWICDIFNKTEKILKENGVILFNLSYGSENTTCMSLTVADIIRNTPFTLADVIVWKKSNAAPVNTSPNKLTRICEFVYVFVRKAEEATFRTNKQKTKVYDVTGQQYYENVFNFITAKNSDESCPLNHATYSTEFVFKLVDMYFKKGDTLLDPFGGTGTTVVACKNCGIDCYSFEISEKQCEWANERIKRDASKVFLW